MDIQLNDWIYYIDSWVQVIDTTDPEVNEDGDPVSISLLTTTDSLPIRLPQSFWTYRPPRDVRRFVGEEGPEEFVPLSKPEKPGEPEGALTAASGWCAPSDEFFDITASRGGVSFTDPYGHLTREQLLERWLDERLENAKLVAKVRKLKETRRRLRRIVEENR